VEEGSVPLRLLGLDLSQSSRKLSSDVLGIGLVSASDFIVIRHETGCTKLIQVTSLNLNVFLGRLD
jgi:hypothetical protein